MDDNTVAICALNRIFGYHPLLAHNLIKQAGNAIAVFSGPAVSIPEHPELAQQVNPDAMEDARRELERVISLGCRFLTYDSDDYPARLLECPDAPLGLYLSATSSPAEIFSLRPLIAFVGTRDLSQYGKTWCRNLVMALAAVRTPPAIVSGLAIGADAVAHAAALECGLPTVGVMATGIESVYPWQNRNLAARIVNSPGSALLTDYPLGTSPVALNFIRRNRIIAGLASATVVIESKTKGGSLMTARFACEYSRDVFAVPGRLDDTRSAGCNSLISCHMAEILLSPEDLAAKLGLAPARRGPGGSWKSGKGGEEAFRRQLARILGEDSPAVAVALAICENSGCNSESLSALTGLPVHRILSSVALLEANGLVTTDPLLRYHISPS